MAAAALVVAAIVVGAPADAAVTADAAPRDLRPVQECADLAAWLAHLGGDCGAAGLTRGGETGAAALCDAVAGGAGGAGACAARAAADAEASARVHAALRRVKARRARGAWRGTAAFTISAYNNWGVVRPFLESLLAHAPRRRRRSPGRLRVARGRLTAAPHRTSRRRRTYPSSCGSSPTRGTPATRRWPPSAASSRPSRRARRRRPSRPRRSTICGP